LFNINTNMSCWKMIGSEAYIFINALFFSILAPLKNPINDELVFDSKLKSDLLHVLILQSFIVKKSFQFCIKKQCNLVQQTLANSKYICTSYGIQDWYTNFWLTILCQQQKNKLRKSLLYSSTFPPSRSTCNLYIDIAVRNIIHKIWIFF
jgi:hypothetical protein